ncbi:hypothetical protein GALMADRAFT_215434 [Galerina marginata CBS 339.88]|uniref:Ketoreductase (KR) domain-containing protein n=1 Tax=Galerina marginata (strain CBS 339.88) TaxID=685588 RepID=A0A067SD59_GALM3|nr:hypothetical protein GALMADRAFT_215434 [Galerina marginata CBS 339.88]
MPPFALIKASNDGYCPPYVPVVVVFGGTSGIGKAMTKRLSEQLDGWVHIIVVGRNKAAADALFTSLPKPTGSQQELERCGYEFISCDILLMKNVHQAADDIARRCPKINYLILASGKPIFGNMEETEEGLNSQLALRYYWKFAVTNDLLLNLRAAKDIGQAAGVFVILGNGMGPKINFDDLGVKKYHQYGVGPIWKGVSYGDLMLAMYAEREPAIAFTHMYPGLVNTEGNSPSAVSSWIAKLLLLLLRPLAVLFFIKVDVSAENMIFGLLNGERGFYQRNTVADNIGPRNVSYSESDKQAFWEHSLSATRSVPR